MKHMARFILETDHPSRRIIHLNTGRTMRRTISVSCDSSRVNTEPCWTYVQWIVSLPAFGLTFSAFVLFLELVRRKVISQSPLRFLRRLDCSKTSSTQVSQAARCIVFSPH